MPVGGAPAGGEVAVGGGDAAVDVVCFGAGAVVVWVAVLSWWEGCGVLCVCVAEPSVLAAEGCCMPSEVLALPAAVEVCVCVAEERRGAARRRAAASAAACE